MSAHNNRGIRCTRSQSPVLPTVTAAPQPQVRDGNIRKVHTTTGQRTDGTGPAAHGLDRTSPRLASPGACPGPPRGPGGAPPPAAAWPPLPVQPPSPSAACASGRGLRRKGGIHTEKLRGISRNLGVGFMACVVAACGAACTAGAAWAGRMQARRPMGAPSPWAGPSLHQSRFPPPALHPIHQPWGAANTATKSRFPLLIDSFAQVGVERVKGAAEH